MKHYQKSAMRRRFIGKIRKLRRNLDNIIFPGLIILTIFIFTQIPSNQPQRAGAENEVRGTEIPQGIQEPSATVSASPTPSAQPILTDKEYMLSLPYGKLVWQTYGHESSFGKNDGCLEQGQYNGFGFGQSKFGYQCFPSVRAVAKMVSDWFVNHDDMGIDSMLCYYNKGLIMSDCNYAEVTMNL